MCVKDKAAYLSKPSKTIILDGFCFYKGFYKVKYTLLTIRKKKSDKTTQNEIYRLKTILILYILFNFEILPYIFLKHNDTIIFHFISYTFFYNSFAVNKRND